MDDVLSFVLMTDPAAPVVVVSAAAAVIKMTVFSAM